MANGVALEGGGEGSRFRPQAVRFSTPRLIGARGFETSTSFVGADFTTASGLDDPGFFPTAHFLPPSPMRVKCCADNQRLGYRNALFW
jgi:hypothetical protein